MNEHVTHKSTTPPATVRQFKSRVEKLARKSNPEAEGMTLTWTFGPQAVVFPTGYKGFTGGLRCEAPGYHTQNMTASYVEGGGLMVR